jgi:protein SERAC1
MKDIVQSTLATIFIACPHRDTQYGKLGDAVASMAGAVLGVRSNDPILQDLSGANSAMLNLARQSFTRLWNDYNFRVRTFHEKLPIGSTLRDQKPEHVSLYTLV